MIHEWILSVGPVDASSLGDALHAEYATTKEHRELRASNVFAKTTLEANGAPSAAERAAIMAKAEEERKLATFPAEVDLQVDTAIGAAVAVAKALGCARVGVSIRGRYDEDVRDDNINHRISVDVDQVK